MKALLLDDNPFALKLLARQLATLGCADVALCERARDAMDLLQQEFLTIDLIFCDLQMPDIDGVEFVRHLARIGFPGHLVLVSGEDRRLLQTVRRLAEAHRIQVLAALSKPVSNEQLKEVFDQLANRREAPARALQRALEPDDLRRGIEEGELLNHYQPKVDLASGAWIGVETLVRWRHPALGMVYPDQFIGMAEKHGLIDALTHAVLMAALNQARVWRDGGLDLQLSVNVSMDNLSALDIPDVVSHMADAAGVPLASLTLEVTESRLMQDLRAPLDILTRLRLKGISLSIDDFGTGHSSLAQLRDIPFDELKLDRSFIHGATQDASLRAIVEATLGMARQLDMKTVAEGVENLDDWKLLRQLSCDAAQGYFIARPMPASDLAGWHVDWELQHGALGSS